MNTTTTPLINKKVVFEYHLLAVVVIVAYLMLSLRIQTFWEVLPVISTAGLCLIAARMVFHVQRPAWVNRYSFIKNQQQQLLFDFSPYLFAALVVLFIEAYLLEHALIFTSKVTLAIISVGFYSAAGLSLEAEYGYIKHPQTAETKNISQIMPAGRKLRYALLILLGLALLLLSLTGLAHSHYEDQHNVFELLFVSIVVTGFSLYLLYLYNRNFIHVIGRHVKALGDFNEGQFDVVIPSVGDDELALLAHYHNIMIERLRDRDRLYRTLEKSVGANIMQKLLNTDEQTLKQGQTYNVAILFCDLRGFTSLGESASAEEIIMFLNIYFADVSSVISEHNGIINKFMGDAVLAIFGLESDGNPVEDAVNASLAIIQHSTDFYMPNDMHPETGIGIDFGAVIGGTIGSEERYEYTIIGDAVNKASRLESLSKRLGYSVILSQNAYKWLSTEIRENFESLGAHRVRGGNEALTIYGHGKTQKESQNEEE